MRERLAHRAELHNAPGTIVHNATRCSLPGLKRVARTKVVSDLMRQSLPRITGYVVDATVIAPVALIAQLLVSGDPGRPSCLVRKAVIDNLPGGQLVAKHGCAVPCAVRRYPISQRIKLAFDVVGVGDRARVAVVAIVVPRDIVGASLDR